MSENGRLPASDLAPIPQGELRKDAAAAWNAPGGPADQDIVPTGSMSSYRTYDEQVYLWGLYQNGTGNLAAVPGTSNHGWGVAIDVPQDWMKTWIRDRGDEYGWEKTEAFSEDWHFNFVGGVDFPTFKSLKKGDRGLRVGRFSRRLRYLRPPNGKRPYLSRTFWKFKQGMVDAVKEFQRDHGMTADGIIGPRTANRINATFERQWKRRGK